MKDSEKKIDPQMCKHIQNPQELRFKLLVFEFIIGFLLLILREELLGKRCVFPPLFFHSLSFFLPARIFDYFL